MHIVFLPSWYPRNPEDVGGSFFREQALALKDAGNQVGVIVSELRSIRQPVQAILQSLKMTYEIDLGIPTYRKYTPNFTPGKAQLTRKRIVRNGMKMFDRYIQEHGKPDLIHVHASLYAGAVALELKKRHRIPFIVSEHSSAYERKLLSPSAISLAAEIVAGAERLFAVSTPFAAILENALNMPTGTWATMANSVNESFLVEPLHMPKTTRFTFLHVSNLQPLKNVDVILKAFAAQFRGVADMRLTIVGDGPDATKLRDLASELEISDQTKFTGMLSRDRVRAEMAQSNAFLLSSTSETFGVVLIEAIAMGLPVIATRCGGPVDIVDDTIGILVDVADIPSYAEAMSTLHSNIKRYPRESLRNFCRERYSAEVLTRRWMEIYAQVIEKEQSAAGTS